MKTGIELIAAERERQITAEGWTPAHDDCYQKGELILAGICYAAEAHGDVGARLAANVDELWPWGRQWWKPSDDPVRDLVKAAALFAAAIDCLNRQNRHSADTAGLRHEKYMNTPQDPEAAETVQTTNAPAVELPRLVRLFFSGETVSRYCGSGDRSDPMNWLHVTWITVDIKSDRAATWWGFGSAFINDRIVFEILRHPEQWEIIPPNVKCPPTGATEKEVEP